MSSPVFIGRHKELQDIEQLYKQQKKSLVVIKGRRRIGKSRFVSEVASRHSKGTCWSFAGLAPETSMNAQTQRDHVARQLALQLHLPPFTCTDWTDVFEHISRHLQPGDMVLLDEISWMGSEDSTFIPKLKAWYDKQEVFFMLFICGSVSTWIEENILKSTAFFGRINLTLTLNPLSIQESTLFLRELGFQGSAYDVYKLLSILGGVPWYLEQVLKGQTADAILQSLCFKEEGLLVLEFDRIFHDLFARKGASYRAIIESLKDGIKTRSEIQKAIGFAKSGTLSNLMGHLVTAGFVAKHTPYSFKTHKPLKQSLYRISDPYMRFYLKLIEPARNKIDLGGFDDISLSKLPGFDSHMGLQLECLLLQNRLSLLRSIGIVTSDIVSDGPYRQSKTSTQRGCQIDYLVQTATNTIFVCEFKFKRRELGVEVIDNMKEKIDALKVPRGFATPPVLFHLGGVSSSVEESGYFYRIIDITDYLDE